MAPACIQPVRGAHYRGDDTPDSNQSEEDNAWPLIRRAEVDMTPRFRHARPIGLLITHTVANTTDTRGMPTGTNPRRAILMFRLGI